MRNPQQLTYINIMLDTLRKKNMLLEALMSDTEKQAAILEEESLDVNAFNETISSKEESLNALAKLDEGFMEMYERVNETLKSNGSDYADEIIQAKSLIKEQMDVSVRLQALEEKNKNKLAIHLTNGKQKVKDFKVSSKTAAAYYKNMTNRHQLGDSYFMDQKK